VWDVRFRRARALPTADLRTPSPLAEPSPSGDGHRVPFVGQVVGIGALEPFPSRPIVATKTFVLAAAINAIEAIDRSAVLEPLHAPRRE
jgi:hypothetical protein